MGPVSWLVVWRLYSQYTGPRSPISWGYHNVISKYNHVICIVNLYLCMAKFLGVFLKKIDYSLRFGKISSCTVLFPTRQAHLHSHRYWSCVVTIVQIYAEITTHEDNEVEEFYTIDLILLIRCLKSNIKKVISRYRHKQWPIQAWRWKWKWNVT